ncbi:tripartite motif-containing protein 16 [Nothobranchius furzeri]|uniref:Tripartite motif-containing protein 16-like n=1 Tax=Nothobranchius furzeri TaxID=105023 RepID=A0A8C6L2Q8_NOTFU|nr:tripartite motif-containing protein 16 isoform X2 [Nothobranchius furzeri]KAF7223825.1 tripartite motif-containing protein 16-like [Nothobranchius furzeri]
MADSGFSSPPDTFCPLCADGLSDPVTIPCGDTFCLECIKIYWDQYDHTGVYSCPQCRATFTPRPVLRLDLPDVQYQLHQQLPELTPFPDLHRESYCDFCVGRRNKAVKSCLMCLAYYCETHVKPHYESATFKRHKLVDETGHLDRKICPQHEKGLELFCRSDQMCICVLCTVREHRSHNITSAEEERTEKQKILIVTQSEVQHIISDRMKELQELKHNVDVLKKNAQRAQTESDKTFHEMLQAVERWKSEINQMIMANMQAAMLQAEGYLDRLEQEIQELQRRDAELRQILETEDNIHFLQNFPTLRVPPEAMVPKVLINPQFSFGEISRTATEMKENLDDICKKELSKISKTVSDTPIYILLPRNGDKCLKVPSRVNLQEPKMRSDFLRYSCRLSFDQNTVYKELVLTDGNKRVSRKKSIQFYPDHPERFDGFSQVLCKEPLSGFRFYWEAEWSGEFSIGVAYKSISRKGKNSQSLLGYNDKSWSLLCSDSGYSVWHNKVDKDLPDAPRASRIGVYLDYAGNVLAFYSVSDTMQLIHRFKAQFSEPLYAGFGVGSSVTLCQLKPNNVP